MKRLIAAIALVLVTAVPRVAFGQEANPAFWLLTPLFGQIAECSKYGDEMRQRLKASLEIAEKTSSHVLPTQTWVLLGGAVLSKGNESPTQEVKKMCDAVIELYRNPQFTTKFRQYLATQFASSNSLRCVVQQPSTAVRVKNAWLKAFARNGFELSEELINNLAASIANTLNGRSPPSLDECEEVASYLDSADFDAQYSEGGVRKLFEGQK